MRLWVLGLVIVASSPLRGQGQMIFEDTVHDFGNIREVDGAAEFTFKFVNSGDTTLQLLSVKASCGCTSPLWSQEPIQAGDTGQIMVRYNTRNRPGPFNKSISVTSNGEPENQSLFIRGQVEPRPRTIEDELPNKIGNLRLKHRSLNMGKITTEKVTKKHFAVYNDSDSVIRFDTTKMELPEHILMRFEPIELGARQRGILEISYDPEKKNVLGYQSDRVVIATADSLESKMDLYVVSTVEEYFPPMSEQELTDAPKLKLSRKVVDVGSVNQGQVAKAVFVIKNDGKNELVIRSVKPNCACLNPQLEAEKIPGNGSIKLTVEFDTSGRRGRQMMNVSIFSNDPKASAQMVTIRADVKE